MTRRLVYACPFALAAAPWPAAAQPWFQGIGMIPGGASSSATGVSADGQYVVGFGDFGVGDAAFRWTRAGGFVTLGDLPDGLLDSQAFAVSSRGFHVVGVASTKTGDAGFRWQGGTMNAVGELAGGLSQSLVSAVSADGSIRVGWSHAGGPPHYQAFRSIGGGLPEALAALPGGAPDSYALGISADGSVVVGQSGSEAGYQAFRWTRSGGSVGLGFLPDGSFSGADGVSADGSVVVGFCQTPFGTEAFR